MSTTVTRPRATTWPPTEPSKHPSVVLSVLERAADDISFFGQLSEDHTMALKDYKLTWVERVALTTGDVGLLERLTGRKLDERVMDRVIIPLLSRERW